MDFFTEEQKNNAKLILDFVELPTDVQTGEQLKPVDSDGNEIALDDPDVHAEYGFSSAARIFGCPAHAALGVGLSSPESRYAKEGSVFHHFGEEVILNRENKRKLKKIIDKAVPEMQPYLEEWLELDEAIREKFLVPGKPYRQLLEVKVFLKNNVWGTLDYALVFQDEDGKIGAVILDAKYGEGVVVSAKENNQLQGYAAALNNHFNHEISYFIFYIYQPRTEGLPIERWDAKTNPVIHNYRESYLAQVAYCERIKSGKVPVTEENQVMGSWCQFCKVQKNGKCNVYKINKMGNTLALFNKAVKTIKKKADLKDVKRYAGFIPDEDRVFIALNKSDIVNCVSAIATGVTNELMVGKKIAGAKMIETTDKRDWKDDLRFVKEGLEELGVKDIETEIRETKFISISAVEKLLGKGKIKHLVKKTGKNYKLVPEDDDRPAAKLGLDTKAMFTNND